MKTNIEEAKKRLKELVVAYNFEQLNKNKGSGGGYTCFVKNEELVLDTTKLAEVLNLKPATIKKKLFTAPHTLPPAFYLPGSRKPQWLIKTVEAWLGEMEAAYIRGGENEVSKVATTIIGKRRKNSQNSDSPISQKSRA